MTRLLYLLILSLLTTTVCLGQEEQKHRIDSLKSELENAAGDTTKVNLLIAMSTSYADEMQHEKSLKYAYDALKIAKASNWTKGVGLAEYSIGMTLAKKEELKGALEHFHASLKKYTEIYDYETQGRLLNNIGIMYERLQEDEKALEYRFKAVELSKKIGKLIDVAYYMQVIGQYYAYKNNFPEALNYWVQSLKLKDEIRDTTVRTLLDNLALVHRYLGNHSASLEYYSRAFDSSVQRKDKEWQSEVLNGMARAYWDLGRYRDAIASFHAALNLKRALLDGFGCGLILNQIGGVYSQLGDYDKALQYGTIALKISYAINANELIATNLNDLTLTYQAIGEYDKALQFLRDALKRFSREPDNEYFVAGIRGNIAVLHAHQGEYDQAFEQLDYGIKLLEKSNSPSDIANLLIEKAKIFNEQNKYAESLNELFSTLALLGKTDGTLQVSKIGSVIGDVYLKMAKDTSRLRLPDSLASYSRTMLLRKAIDFLNRSSAINLEVGNINDLQENYKSLSNAHELSGNSIAALAAYRDYIRYRDSLFSVDKVKAFTRQDMKYDTDRKEAEAKKEFALAAEKHAATVRSVLLGAAVIILVALLVFYFHRKREQDKHALQLLQLKQEALNAQMSDHFISNTMDSINQFIRSNDKEKASEYLILFSRLIRKVLENATERMVTLEEDLDILRDYLELEKLRFLNDSLDYEIIVDGTIDPTRTLIPPMVFQTLAENSLKHGFKKAEGGRLRFKISRLAGSIECIVEDNGVGRKASIHFAEPRASVHVSMGSSLAEKLIKSISKYGKETSYRITDLFDQSNNPSGTMVRFEIPYITND